MAKTRTLVLFTKEVLSDLDLIAKIEGVSRSQLLQAIASDFTTKWFLAREAVGAVRAQLAPVQHEAPINVVRPLSPGRGGVSEHPRKNAAPQGDYIPETPCKGCGRSYAESPRNWYVNKQFKKEPRRLCLECERERQRRARSEKDKGVRGAGVRLRKDAGG